MSYTIRKINNPTHEQIEELRAVFDAAFATEHAFKCIVGPDHFDKLLQILNRSQIVAGALGGDIFVAEDNNNKKIVGGIIWYDGDRGQYDSEDQRKQALIPLMESFPRDVKEWYLNCAPKMERFKKATFGDLEKTDRYLQRVGVHPSWQGRGVGTALIEYGREKTDGHSIALQAVEPSNVGYYEYIDFKNKGHIDVEALHGNFIVTGLLWQPIDASAA